MVLRILAFEPFDAGSHRAVREAISRHARHDWQWITRPGRAWKWRMRLGAIEMLEEARQRGLLKPDIDVIVATSLLGAADLRALLPRGLRNRPLVLYMHENQAAYPAGHVTDVGTDRDVHFALTNLTSILASDRVLWNSAWNLESCLAALGDVLRHAPDATTGDIAGMVRARSRVIWPPVEPPPSGIASIRRGGGPDGVLHNPIRVVWPHRWEHDKGVDELLEIAAQQTERLDLRWTILGEAFREVPPAMETFRRRFAARIDHIGFEPDRGAYWRRLAACDWVLSTARHEFFGIAVVEAMLAGCLPWLPDRLSYPELLPESARGLGPEAPPRDPEAVRRAIARHLEPCRAPDAVRAIETSIEEVMASDSRQQARI